MDRTGPQVHVTPVRCPYCHEGIPKGEAPAVCAECHALHHAACMNEHGACAACGKKTSSPEDSKLAAALRARASARLEGHKESEPPEPPSAMLAVMCGALGAILAGGAVVLLDLPSVIPLVMAAVLGALFGSTVGWHAQR
jgi:hypothetical protein